jgi:AraC-like DNA-binding protein
MITQLSKSQFMREKKLPFSIVSCIHENNQVSLHGHDFVELVYIVDGEARHCFEGEQYDVKSGDVFIINPGELHSYEINPGERLEIINCLFTPELIHETLLRELGISQSMDYFYVHPFLDKRERFHHRLNLTGKDARRVMSLLESMIEEWEARDSNFCTVIKLLMLELLVLLSRYYNQKQEPLKTGRATVAKRTGEHRLMIRRINGFLERHYDQKLSITSLCELYNISKRQLNRIFKQETGQTVIDRIHEIRIDKAKQYLLDSDDKVILVANRVGYEDPAFFSQLFRRRVGCSPGKYREVEAEDEAEGSFGELGSSQLSAGG